MREEVYMKIRQCIKKIAFLCLVAGLLISGILGMGVSAQKKKTVISSKKLILSVGQKKKLKVKKKNKTVKWSSGNKKVAITERGTTFGYQDLLVDFRGIPEMKSFGYPVILDVTHSLQQPNQTSGVTGGMPQLIETIARAGIATGADGLFMETHPEPEKAKSDGANMLRLDLLEGLLVRLTAIRETINKFDK